MHSILYIIFCSKSKILKFALTRVKGPANGAVGDVLLFLGDDHGAEEVAADAANLVGGVDTEETHFTSFGPDFAGDVANLVPLRLVRLDSVLEEAADRLAEHVMIFVENAFRRLFQKIAKSGENSIMVAYSKNMGYIS